MNNVEKDLNTLALIGAAFEGTTFDKVFKSVLRESFEKYSKTEDPITAYQKANKDAVFKSIVHLPLIMRINYLLGTFKKYNNSDSSDNIISEVVDMDSITDWNKINEMLKENISHNDYNCGEREVHSVDELNQYRVDIELALQNIQPWITRKCKDCGESFSIFFSEVEYFTNKDMQLPKRCKSCRKNRKDAANKKIDNNHDKLFAISKEKDEEWKQRLEDIKKDRHEFNSAPMAEAFKRAGL